MYGDRWLRLFPSSSPSLRLTWWGMAWQEYIVNKLQKQLTRLANEKQLLQVEKSDLQRQVLVPEIQASYLIYLYL